MRLAALALLLPLAACSGGVSREANADPADMIECAVDGASSFARDCVVRRSLENDTLFLTVHHPDGGFRRFEVSVDGKSLTAADGADTAQVIQSGDTNEVSVGGDRYRLPLTLGESSDGQAD